jgi:hypothetical protein
LHTKIQITKHLLTFRPRKRRDRFFKLFESRAGKRMAVHAVEALNSEEEAQKSWFHAGVENGLRRGKPWWLPMIGGHRSVAKGVGERAEAAEGLYLGWGPRYSRRKRGLWWSSWSRGGKNKVMLFGDVWCCVRCACLLPPSSPLLSPLRWLKKMAKTFYFPTHWSL